MMYCEELFCVIALSIFDALYRTSKLHALVDGLGV